MRRFFGAFLILIGLCGMAASLPVFWREPSAPGSAQAASPAASREFSVQATTPTKEDWPISIQASGSIFPWQEASVSSEAAGLMIRELLAQEGQTVRKGDTLAVLSSSTLLPELASAKAVLEQAKLREAAATDAARRARAAAPSGAVSAQALFQANSAEKLAKADLANAQASVSLISARLAQTKIIAPDDGLILSRPATLGMVAQPGMELFRILRQGRLEWRALVPASMASSIEPGQQVSISIPGASAGADPTILKSTVREIAPLLDPASRMAIIRIDIPASAHLHIGQFAQGSVQIGTSPAIAIPQSAITFRDGNSYVFEISPTHQAFERKIRLGRLLGKKAEILSGLNPQSQIVLSGGQFLQDGDAVRLQP